MLELIIDKLPGGDASRRTCLARVTLTNTGEGGDGVRTYDVRVTHFAARGGDELPVTACRTFRDEGEGVLHLVHRALSRLLSDRPEDTR
jgi:hypothetical protein